MNPEEKASDKTLNHAQPKIETTLNAPPAPAPALPPKTETKTEKLPSKKGTKVEEKIPSGKPTKKKGKKTEWVKKGKIMKDQKTKEIRETLKEKRKPNFWGRFGKKNLRTQRMKKFNKWRKPRGIDILFERNDGSIPQAGYRTPKSIRGTHPSGYQEVLVFSKKDLGNLKQNQAARLSSTIGRKKRIELIKLANEKKIRILN